MIGAVVIGAIVSTIGLGVLVIIVMEILTLEIDLKKSPIVMHNGRFFTVNQIIA